MPDDNGSVPEDLQKQDYFAHLRMPTDPDADAWADLEPDGTDFETEDAPDADTNASVRESFESSLEAEDEAEA